MKEEMFVICMRLQGIKKMYITEIKREEGKDPVYVYGTTDKAKAMVFNREEAEKIYNERHRDMIGVEICGYP